MTEQARPSQIKFSTRRWLLPLTFWVVFNGVYGYSQTNQAPPPRKKLFNPPYPNGPVKPFRIMGNIYYAGMQNNTSFVIKTSDGVILLDTMEQGLVAALRKNLDELGVQPNDIKIILQAHAHIDHIGGLATMKELTGAKVWVMAQDEQVLADGGKTEFRGTGKQLWTPVKADGILHDGDKVKLGNTTMVAHLTAGHTMGCTTWTVQTEDEGKKYNVVFACSARMNDGVPLLNNPKYPNIAADFANQFKTLKRLPCDVFLASHAYMFDLEPKKKRLDAGEKPNPFIDPKGYREYISDYETAFEDQLKIERAGGPPPPR
jgi:metallo-beta-lactamase class B